MAKTPRLQPFVVPEDSPLAAEHAAVARWVEESTDRVGGNYWHDLDLKTIPSGEALLAGKPEQSKRYVLAAVAQARHWEAVREWLASDAGEDPTQTSARDQEEGRRVWSLRRQAVAVVSALTRRTLPFDQLDLLAIVQWCCETEQISSYHFPIGSIVRSVTRSVGTIPIEPDLRTALLSFSSRLRASNEKDVRRYGTDIEQLCGGGQAAMETTPAQPALPTPVPAPAGSPYVLSALKRYLGMLPAEPLPASTVLEPDQFPRPDESPLRAEHELLSKLFEEYSDTPAHQAPDLAKCPSGQRILGLSPDALGRVLLANAERHVYWLLPTTPAPVEQGGWRSCSIAAGFVEELKGCSTEFDRDGAFDLLLYLSSLPPHLQEGIRDTASPLAALVGAFAAESPLTEGERFVLFLFRAAVVSGPMLGNLPDDIAALNTLIQDGAAFFLAPGEVWTETVNRDLSAVGAASGANWSALFRHALSATSSRPSAKWLKTAGQLIQTLGEEVVRKSLLNWLPLVSRGSVVRKLAAYVGDTRTASDTMHAENADCLRGLLWCVPLLPRRDELARVVTAVAISAYRKVPGVGPRAVKVGNAAVYALSELASKEAVGQLAMLKLRVRFGSAQKEIEKAFDAAATALSLPRDQIEELGVPSYGLEEVGHLSEELGTYRAELLVNGSTAGLNWFDAAGKALKSVPAKVKTEHKEELKELQQSLKDIQAMLPAQRDRLDGLFLLQKTWPIGEWRERYHDHPLVGTIGRRLLWCVDGSPAFFRDGLPTDVHGQVLAHGKTAEITLWHPVGRAVEEIVAWRRRLEELGITQPFKQAHREVYLLTDAERNTRTYSNRYAAHVIRQHQFNALCAARGWKNKLRLMVDDTYPPASRDLPQWGLRAEFWIEGIGGDYGVDTNDAGSFLRLATDQVRFYRTEAATNFAHAGGGGYGSIATGPGEGHVNEPLPLDEVPPLVFSEIMRDVDLFVGVASVGNDPAWQDGGPGGRFRDYWHGYSFGELSGSATTRKQVLERLIPRLKIASRCSFSERFLVVRGDKRTYKIHLGSGNILMEPNDQYLCIVPDSKARSADGDLYLPFEGDATLSIIISKALLLADDTKIKDPTITRQIEMR
jgi:hypothetical protein